MKVGISFDFVKASCDGDNGTGFMFWHYARECEKRLSTSTLRRTSVTEESSTGFRVLLIADPHLLGSHRRIWIDIFWSDWGLFKATSAALLLHSPELILIDGDVFDEGSFCSDAEFER